MFEYQLTGKIHYKDDVINSLALYQLSFKTMEAYSIIKAEVMKTSMQALTIIKSIKDTEDLLEEAKEEVKQAAQENEEDRLQAKNVQAEQLILFGLDVSKILNLLIKKELVRIVHPNVGPLGLKEADFPEDLSIADAEGVVKAYLVNFFLEQGTMKI